MASNVGAAVRSGVHGWMECVRVAAGRQSDRERGRGACGLCGADLAQVGGWWCVGSWYVCPAGPLMMVHQSAGRACLWRSVGTAAAVGLGYVPTSACKGLYIRLHCLRTLCPLQEHTTFNESLVCYTSPPGGVYVLDVIPGVSIIRSGGCRGRSGGCLLGLGRPARSTGPDCPDSQATCDRHGSTRRRERWWPFLLCFMGSNFLSGLAETCTLPCPLKCGILTTGKIGTQAVSFLAKGLSVQHSGRAARYYAETKALFIFAGDSFASCWRRG